VFAGVDHWQTHMQAGGYGRSDAGNLCCEHLGGINMLEESGEFNAARIHQLRIHLMVDESIYLQDTATQVSSLFLNPFFQSFQGILLN
jgi:hypothetical protein